MKEASAFRSSVILLGLGRVATMTATLVTVAVIARQLGVRGYGDFRTIIAFLTFALVFANLGTPLIIQRELAKIGANQGHVLGNALGLRIVSVAIALAIAGLIASLSPRPFVAVGVAVGAIGFIAMGVHQVLFTLFQQRLRQAGAVIAETTGALALLVMAWTLGKTDFGVLAFVAATAAASLLTATISLSFAVKLLRFRPKFNISSWKALLVPAAPIAVTNVLSLVYYRFDIIILSFMHPAEAVGLYGVPSKILDASMGFTLLFSGLVMPLMSRYIDTDFQKFRLYFDTGVDTLVMGTSGLLVVILVFAEEILTAIAGQPFSDGAPALRVLGLVIVVASSRYMLYQAATVLNVQRKVVGGYVVAAIVGVLAYLLLIPSFAGAGAAIGLLVGELIVFVWTLRVLFQSGMQLTAKVHVKILVSVCFTVGLFFWLKSTSSIHWMLGAVFAPLVYFVFLSIIGGVPTHVLELIRPARSVNDSKISADDDDLMKP